MLRPLRLPDPPNEDLVALRVFFGPLTVFDPGPGGEATRYDSIGDVGDDAYESAGKLFFSLDHSPESNVHHQSLFAFARKWTPVVLPIPVQHLEGLFFMKRESDFAILEGFEKRDSRRVHYWKLRDGVFTTVYGKAAARSELAIPQPQTPATCHVHDGAITFVEGGNTMDVSPEALATASHGIASESGIIIGCRRVGTTNLLWLSANEDTQDGVTFVAQAGRLRPLFIGHPFIQTYHYLVFTHEDDPKSDRHYLFVRSDSKTKDKRLPHGAAAPSHCSRVRNR